MVDVIMKNEILTRFRNNESKRSIARNLGCSRNTVDKYVKEYLILDEQLLNETNPGTIALIQKEICAPPKTKSHTRKRMAFTKDVEQRFMELVSLDEERNRMLGRNKQGVTASLLHKTLVDEGYNIGLTTITNAFRKYKDKPRECFIKQEYDFGQRAEFDFHQIKVNVDGKNRKYYQATITLPKSDIVFGALYNNETFNSVNDSIIKFFNYIGGVPTEMVFDNMSTVVKRFLDKGKKQYTSNIRSLSTYYGFKIETTNPRRGNEKGHVEVSGKEIRKKLFSLKFKFSSEEELFKYYKLGIDNLNSNKQDSLVNEQKHLKPLPVKDLLLYEISTNKVDSYGLIRVLNNFYSVPDKYVGAKVSTHAYLDKLIIYHNNLEICQHIKKEGFKEYSLDFNHYLKTFLRKPGALKNSLALKQAPLVLQTLYYEDYNTDPKGFLAFISNKEPATKELVTIKDVSINQLNSYNHLFEMGDN